jgi:glycosyltransferase involved in cell wall biosynthesis
VKTDTGKEKIFAYVDPKQAGMQNEMEVVFTDHLKRIGAFLAPDSQRTATGEENKSSFPVEASVIIPVRNRKSTVADAVKSALSQETDFPFNVIVVDNNSTDGTTELLSDLAKSHGSLKHLIPSRTDLGIGGCWNEALMSHHCGRYSVQLDSDDLYAGTFILRRIVDMFRRENYAMVIGSYTIVNFNLEVIAPGLIDHREWTAENGRNNALRINGLGAPRAFHTGIMRGVQFLNVSYGEDYAATLRMCREYRIGRIYENLYLCRRWPGNTDAALPMEAQNRNDAFKDKIRTDEILARQKLNKRKEKIINA